MGWELWAKNRLGLTVIAAWIVIAALLIRVLPEDLAVVLIAKPTLTLAWFICLYVSWVFIYAESTLAGNATGFPPRLFTMPVRTSILVALPMLFGGATIALTMLGLELAIRIPFEETISDVSGWPALTVPLLASACLAAFQAICWTVVRAPLLRIAVAVLGLPIFAVFELFHRVHTRRFPTVAVSVPMVCTVIAGAYVVAVIGVGYDRSGVRLSLAGVWEFIARELTKALGRRRAFASPSEAQRWLEQRRHGWLVPLLIASSLIVLSWPTESPFYRVDVLNAVLKLLGFLPLLALFLGIGLGKTNFWTRDLRLSPFIATHPQSSEAIARAKLDTAGLCAARTWGYLVLLLPLLVLLLPMVGVGENKSGPHQHLVHQLFLGGSLAKSLGFFPVALAGVVGLTWLNFVAGTCLSICGRDWILNGVAPGYALGYVMVATALISILHSVASDSVISTETVRSILSGLCVLGETLMLTKVIALASVLRLPWHSRTIPILIAWSAIAACLLISLYGLVPVNPVPHWLVALYLLITLPLNRPLLLPAAIAWNRHR